MKELRHAAAFLLCYAAMVGAQDQAPVAPLHQADYHSHFEPNPGASVDSGSRDGWESFPLSQEAGYDPTINPETRHGESMLVREAAPAQDGPMRLGFVRRVHMVSGPHASVSVRVRAPYATGMTPISLSIYRGQKEERHPFRVTGEHWTFIECPIKASGQSITAFAVAAEFPRAVRGRLERLEMQSASLKGLAVKRIDISESEALWDASREFYYMQHALHPGEALAVKAKSGTMEGVRWELNDPGGHEVTHGTGGKVLYHLPVAAPLGIWTLRLLSREARSTALILVRSEGPQSLLFDRPPPISKALLESIRTRKALLKKTTHAEMGRNIASMDPDWLLAGLPSYFALLLQPPELAMLDAMEFRATADPVALEEARTLLRVIASWPLWVHPWFPAHGYHSYYPVGILTKYVIVAEQILGSDLPTEDRKAIDASLTRLSVKPIYEEYVLEDRLQFNTSNWIGNTVGGALLAALQSDDPDAAGYALGLYVKDRDHVLAAYTADGSYGEGVTYHRFDLEMTSLVAEASKRLLGQSLDLSLENGDRYMRYAAYGKDGLIDYGDSHADIAPSNVFAYPAALNQSDDLADFYFKYRDTGTAELISRVLWESEIRPVAHPAVPPNPSLLFDQRGIVVLRDGWSEDATIVAMRAGKNFNHNHADEGSVFVVRHGKLWLGEAGYADYYKDPSYSTFNIQAIGHNTLLVDGNAESQVIPGNSVLGAHPDVTHAMITPEASLVQADLTTAYGESLQLYERTLFFQKSGALIVVDKVQAAKPRLFTQVWHPKQKVASFDPSKNLFRLKDGSDGLQVRAFALGPLTTARRESPLPLTAYEQSESGYIERPARFEISTSTRSRTATIVTTILPSSDRGSGQEPIWNETPHDAILRFGDSGIRIAKDSDPHTEGASIVAWSKDRKFLLHARRYQDDRSRGAIVADRSVDMEIERVSDNLTTVEVDASEPTDLTLIGYMLADESAGRLIHLGKGHASLQLQSMR